MNLLDEQNLDDTTLQNNPLNPVGYHVHNGIDSPRIDLPGLSQQVQDKLQPGGSDTEIQYNDGGVLAGDANFTWDKTARILQFGPDGAYIYAEPSNVVSSGFIDINGAESEDGTVLGGGGIFLGGPGDGEVFISGGSFYTSDGAGGNVGITGGQAVGAYKYGDIQLIARGGGTDDSTTKQGRIVNTDNGNSFAYYKRGWLLTTNATPKNWRIETLLDDCTFFVEIKVSAGVSHGGDGAVYVRRAAYKRNGGAPTLLGSIQDVLTIEDDTNWNVDFVVSGNDLKLQVTGVAATSINWNFEISYMQSTNGNIP